MDKTDELIKEYLLEERLLAEKVGRLLENQHEVEAFKVPSDVVERAKGLMSQKSKGGASCPYCGKTITPFKKPIKRQVFWSVLWFLLAASSFGASFLVPRYFFQFLVLTTVFSFKFILDQKAMKTQILIYKALQADEQAHAPRDLHQSSSRL